jgi:hypothetical protein
MGMTDLPANRRRVLRVASMTAPNSADRHTAAAAVTVGARKLAEYEEGTATDDDETETNQYGESFSQMNLLDDDTKDSGNEWESWDPELESKVADNYGVGDGWVEDDAFHTYFRESDRVIDNSATDDDDETDGDAKGDDDDTQMQADDSYEENEYVFWYLLCTM